MTKKARAAKDEDIGATVGYEAQLWQMADALRGNVSDWGGERLRDDKRRKCGVTPVGNASFAWVQHIVHHHIVHHRVPEGVAGFVLANGSMSSNQSGKGEIRSNVRSRIGA